MTRRSTRRVLSSLILGLAFSAPAGQAVADIAPPTMPYVASPIPLAQAPEQSLELATDTIEIELFPTLVRVRMRLSVRGPTGTGEPWLIGAPRSVPVASFLGPNPFVADLLADALTDDLDLVNLDEELAERPGSRGEPADDPVQESTERPESRALIRAPAVDPPDPAPVRFVSQEPESYGELVLPAPFQSGAWAGVPWGDLEAVVNGTPRVPELRRYQLEDHPRPVDWFWWILALDPPASGEADVELSFVQPLYEWIRTPIPLRDQPRETCVTTGDSSSPRLVVDAFGLVDLTAALPETTRPTEVRVLPRVPVGTAICTDSPLTREPDGSLVLSHDGEAEEDWTWSDMNITLWIPAATTDAPFQSSPPYDLGDLRPVWTVHDRVSRFARSGPAAGVDDDASWDATRDRARLWVPFLSDLRDTALDDPDEESRAFATALLFELAGSCGGMRIVEDGVETFVEDSGCRGWLTDDLSGVSDGAGVTTPNALLRLYGEGHLDDDGEGGASYREASAFGQRHLPVEEAFTRFQRRRNRTWGGAGALAIASLVGIFVWRLRTRR